MKVKFLKQLFIKLILSIYRDLSINKIMQLEVGLFLTANNLRVL